MNEQQVIQVLSVLVPTMISIGLGVWYLSARIAEVKMMGETVGKMQLKMGDLSDRVLRVEIAVGLGREQMG